MAEVQQPHTCHEAAAASNQGLSQPRAHPPLSQHCPYSSHTCPRQPPSRFHSSSLPRPGTMVSVELVLTPVCSQAPPAPLPLPPAPPLPPEWEKQGRIALGLCMLRQEITPSSLLLGMKSCTLAGELSPWTAPPFQC